MSANYKRVYICSPLRDKSWINKIQNAAHAQTYMRQTAEQYGCRAYAPHGYLPFLLDDNDPAERALALSFGKELMKLCDALVVYGDVISEGMCGEIRFAHELGIPILTMGGSFGIEAKIQSIADEKG